MHHEQGVFYVSLSDSTQKFRFFIKHGGFVLIRATFNFYTNVACCQDTKFPTGNTAQWSPVKVLLIFVFSEFTLSCRLDINNPLSVRFDM